jgi:hypothetical protein
MLPASGKLRVVSLHSCLLSSLVLNGGCRGPRKGAIGRILVPRKSPQIINFAVSPAGFRHDTYLSDSAKKIMV